MSKKTKKRSSTPKSSRTTKPEALEAGSGVYVRPTIGEVDDAFKEFEVEGADIRSLVRMANGFRELASAIYYNIDDDEQLGDVLCELRGVMSRALKAAKKA